ncbi:MAG: GntR family transcriptional regulator [Candidatus Nanopelagicales bacterium]
MSDVIVLDPSSAVPPYEQIRSQVEVLVLAGRLPAGTALPTIRQLAHDLGVAPGTVQRAYRELEAAELVEARRRGGTVVRSRSVPRTTRSQRDERLAASARDLVAATRGLGLDLDAAVEALRRQWAVGD